MMKHGVLLILVVMVVSCATPSYMHLYESPKSLDFTTGKWLVTNVETQLPLMYREGLTRDLLKELKKMGGDSIYFLNDISLKYLSHAFELSPEVIGDVKENNGLQTKNSRELKKERGGK